MSHIRTYEELEEELKRARAEIQQQKAEARQQKAEARQQKAQRQEREAKIKALKRRVSLLEAHARREDALWRSNTAADRLDAGAHPKMLHSTELCDAQMQDEAALLRATKCTTEKFGYLLDRFEAWIGNHPEEAPLFRGKQNDRRGNRCKLPPRHALLMTLMHFKDDPTQDSLAFTFAVDQTTVSRYLKLTKGALKDILPTAKNVYEMILNAKDASELAKIMGLGPAPSGSPESVQEGVQEGTPESVQEGVQEDSNNGNPQHILEKLSWDDVMEKRFKRLMGLSPAFGLDEGKRELLECYKEIMADIDMALMVDGTHTQTLRPIDSGERRARYSGKKKFCSFNTTVMTTGRGLVWFIGKSVEGSTGDITLLRDDMPDFAPFGKLGRLILLFMDKGYVGIQKDLRGTSYGP